MTESAVVRTRARRAAVEREILDAAWEVMARDGAAALSVREVARLVGLRQQSLTHYFPTKQSLLDALFVDGFNDLLHRLERLPTVTKPVTEPVTEPVEAVVAVAGTVVDYCVTHPERYHLMFQRSVPHFEPSDASHQQALRCLEVLVTRLAAAGVTRADDVALVRSLISGLAAEQLANDPGGRGFADHTARGVRALVAATSRQGR